MDKNCNEVATVDQHALEAMSGRHVLVTGAGGFIGRQLCLLLAPHVAKLTLVSVSESALYKVSNLLQGAQCEVEAILADYGDAPVMTRVLDGVDTVIHAGAHKHVRICENNPLAAIMNNIWGTQKLLNAAHVKGVRRFIQISTDKAVEPTSIMGATKRVCELLCTRRDYGDMVVSVVRFGNVMGSDGSVIPLWREQIENGGPLTITDRRCTRYFMSVESACRLIFFVLHAGKRGLFVFNMGEPHRMEDVAMRMIGDAQIEIVETGLSPGEKLEEILYHGGRLETTRHKEVFQVIEEGKLQPSHQLIPELVEHSKKGRVKEAVETLWKIVNQAVRV